VSSTNAVTITRLSKKFGQTAAVDNVSFDATAATDVRRSYPYKAAERFRCSEIISPMEPMPSLAGKIAIITGAAQGIGAAYADALADAGAKVSLADILDPRGVAERIRRRGGDAIAIVSDVSDPGSCQLMVSATLDAFGDVDILVNNAAVFASIERKPFEQLTQAEWDHVMAVNVRGPFNAAQAVFPHMKKNRRGKIINISSRSRMTYCGVCAQAYASVS
jgi:NAD(P)-dependent dehydrogenase (short-subunit alcohol dehydrogenase family)